MRTVWRLPRACRLLLCVAALPLGACFKLSRNAPPIRQYVLGGAPAGTSNSTSNGTSNGTSNSTTNGTTATRSTGAYTVGIRRADVAAYLNTPAIVVRRDGNEVISSDFHRWSEPLSEAINRVVATRLATTAPVRAVQVAPWSPRTQLDVLLQLHVRRFEGETADGGAGRIQLDAAWDLILPRDGRVLVRGHTQVRDGAWSAGNYPALVNALDGSLATLARDIASCLAGFRNDSTPPARCGDAM